MNEPEILEIARKVKRFSHRIKNTNNPILHKEALKAVNRILRERSTEKAKHVEDEFIKKLQRVYKVETPDGISFQLPVMNMSDTYVDPNAAAVTKLTDAADTAFANNPDNCSGSVAEVASTAFNITDLNGKQANDQVTFMDANWDTVDAATAQQLANKGQLVIAGQKAATGAGHVAVVVSGDGKTIAGNFYPNVEGGGGPHGQSDGTLTAGDVWPSKPTNPEYRGNVKYYVPKTGGSK
jgi:hypothetical protein